MPETEVQRELFTEIHGMRDDFRKVTVEIAELARDVRHLTEESKETKGHGERIRAVEQDVSNVKSQIQSAATERRWIIGVLVGVAVAVISLLVSMFGQKGHP